MLDRVLSLVVLPVLVSARAEPTHEERGTGKVYAGAPINNISVWTSNLVQCGDVTVHWSNAQPPVELKIGTGGYYVGTDWLDTISSIDSDTTTWTVTQPQGTSMIFQVTDAEGQMSYQQNVHVQSSDDDSCLSSGGGSPSSSGDGVGSTTAAAGTSTAAEGGGGTSTNSAAGGGGTESQSVTRGTTSSSTKKSGSKSVTAAGASTSSSKSPKSKSSTSSSPSALKTSTSASGSSGAGDALAGSGTSGSSSTSTAGSATAALAGANTSGAAGLNVDVPHMGALNGVIALLLIAASAFIWL